MSTLPLSDTGRLTPTRLPLLAPDLAPSLSDSESILDDPLTPESVRHSVDPNLSKMLTPIPFNIPRVLDARANIDAAKAGDLERNRFTFTLPIRAGPGGLFPALKSTETITYGSIGGKVEVDTSFTTARKISVSATLASRNKEPSLLKSAIPKQDVDSPRKRSRSTTSLPSLPRRWTSPDDGSLSIARTLGFTAPTFSCQVQELSNMFTTELDQLLSPKTLYWHRQDARQCSAITSREPSRRCYCPVDHPVTSAYVRQQLTLMSEMNDASAILVRLQSFVPSVICTKGWHVERAGKKIRVLKSKLEDANSACALLDTSIPEPLTQLKNWLRLILSATNEVGLIAGAPDCKISISRWVDVEAASMNTMASGLSDGPVYEWYQPDPQLKASDVIRKWLLKPMAEDDLYAGYLYVYWHPGSFGLVKIGCTRRSIEKRLDEWQQQCGHDAKACMDDQLCSRERVPNVKRLEDLVHAELRPYRVRETDCPCNQKHREWFKASQEHVKQVIQKWTRFVSTKMGRYQQRVGGRLWRRRTPVKHVEWLCTPLPELAVLPRPPARSRKSQASLSRLHSENGQVPIRRKTRLLASSSLAAEPAEEHGDETLRKKRRIKALDRQNARPHRVFSEGSTSTDKAIGNDSVESRVFVDAPTFHPLLCCLLDRVALSDHTLRGLNSHGYRAKMQVARFHHCRAWQWRFYKFARALVLRQKAHKLGGRIQEARIYLQSVRPGQRAGVTEAQFPDLST